MSISGNKFPLFPYKKIGKNEKTKKDNKICAIF